MAVLPDAAQARAARQVRSKERELLAGDFAGLSIPLHPPTAAKAAADIDATREFIRQWQDHPLVETAVRNWSGVGLGKQLVPVRLHLNTIDELVDVADCRQEWEVLCRRRDLLIEGGASLAAVVQALPQWRNVADDELRRVGHVVDWFVAHPDSGLLPRAVAVEGVHSKWLEGHRALVEHLVSDRRPEGTDLGLTSPEARVRLRFHPDEAPGGLTDVELPLSSLEGLPTPQVVLMVENLESFLALPTQPRRVWAWGAGYRAVDVAGHAYFQRAPLLYWGDLDSDGFAILDGVRHRVPDARSVLMSPKDVDRWIHLGVPDRAFQVRSYPHLTESESAALDALITAGQLRIEQERIQFDVAVAAVDEVCREAASYSSAVRSASPDSR